MEKESIKTSKLKITKHGNLVNIKRKKLGNVGTEQR